MPKETVQRTQINILEAISRGDKEPELILMDLMKAVENHLEGLMCSILFYNEEHNALQNGMSPSLSKAYLALLDKLPVASDNGSCGRAAHLKQPVIVTDIMNDPLWKEYKIIATQFQLMACWSMPVLSSKKKLLGCFALYYKECRTPSEEELDIMQTFTHLASIIMERMKKDQTVHTLIEKVQLSEMAIDFISDMVTISDPSGQIIFTSPASQSLLGFTATEMLGKRVEEFIFKDDIPNILSCFRYIRRSLSSKMIQIRMINKKGKPIYVETNTSPILNENQEITHFVSTTRDISERKKSEKMVEYLAFHDTLTGLPNRRYLYHQLNDWIKKNNEKDTVFTIFFIDIDRIKAINDVYGHQAGDRVLVEIAKRLKRLTNQSFLLSRWGGDEFLMIFKFINDKNREEIADLVLTIISQPIYYRNHTFSVTASIGISTYPWHGTSIDRLINKADAAMYQSKKLGKNTYTVFSDEMDQMFNTRVFVEAELRKAIKKKEFILCYQPKVCTKTNEVVGVEALIRWIHPIHGFINPGDFIPLAEETGLIIPIGEWVLLEACKQIRKWESYSLKCSVNLSAQQLKDRKIVTLIKETIQKTKIPPHLLELEITESAMMHNLSKTISILQELKDIGVILSVDDFGKSFSSLNYLKQFPVDKVKIDQSFIRDMAYDKRDQEIISSIVQLAHRLNLRVIAEGVETKKQKRMLIEMECDEWQGFYFAKPMRVRELQDLLKYDKQIT